MSCVGISSGLKYSFLKVGKKEEDERKKKGPTKTTPPLKKPQKPRDSGSSESCVIHEVPFQGYKAANDHWGRGDVLGGLSTSCVDSSGDVAFESLPSC